MMLAKGVQETIAAYELVDSAFLPAVVVDSLGVVFVPQGLPKG